MRRKYLTMTNTIILVIAIAATALAAGPIKLYVNGREIKPDVPPHVINGRTMVPVRWVAEALGAQVEWDESAGAVFVKSESAPPALLQRLRSLEPERPKRVEDDWNAEQVKEFLAENKLAEIATIRSEGRRVPFTIVDADDTWSRPAYAAEWHSTFMGGKYSSVSQLVSYARRKLFVYTGGLSEGAGLLYSLGFGEDWGKPVFSNFSYREAFELLLLSGRIKEIYHLNNEWLVVVEPCLKGYQTVKITYADAGMEVEEETVPELQLFRVATPDGYELERTAMNLPVR